VSSGGGAPAPSETRAALGAALVCYGRWGVLPLLFMLMARLGSSSLEILAHRTLWSVIWAGLLVLLARQGPQVRQVLTQPRTMAFLGLSTLLILVNWGGYVWATTNGATLEAALGYYLNPLFNMAAGALIFRERIGRMGKVAIALAAIGVLLQAVALGRPPWISLALATSFCAYAVIRKRVKADAQTGLFVECLYLTLPGLAYVLWLERSGGGNFTDSPGEALVLLANGPATVLPLMLFAWAARRLNLSTMGFLQFIAPTLQFAIGLWAGESFTALRALSFGFIWAGVAVFALAAWRTHRRPALSPHLSDVQTQSTS
jgi:chloramphenicol-sensitive protein RarD